MSLEDYLPEIKELHALGDLDEDFAKWRAAYKVAAGKDSTLTDGDLCVIMASADDDKDISEWVVDMVGMEKSIEEGKIQHA